MLKGREILGGTADLLSAWFGLGGCLVESWRALDAESKRARARPLVEALVRRCNQHRQAAWLEFVFAGKVWHSRSREGHFTFLSPRSYQDDGRRRADPFTETAVLRLLNAYRKGEVRPQDAAWILDALCYAMATAVPGARERVAERIASGGHRLPWIEAQRLFRPRADCRGQPLPEELRLSLQEFISSDDARVGRFNRVWRERLEKKGAAFAPHGPVLSAVAWLVEHLDPKPNSPSPDLASFCHRMRALGRFGQQLRLQVPPAAGTRERVDWADRLSRNLIRLGKLAELVLGGPVSKTPVEIDYLHLAPEAVETTPAPTPATDQPSLFDLAFGPEAKPPAPAPGPPSLFELPSLPEAEPPPHRIEIPDDGLRIGADLPEIREDDQDFHVSRDRLERLEPPRAAATNIGADPSRLVLEQPPEAPTVPRRRRRPSKPIQFQCGACGRLLRVPEANAGRRFRCPACEAVSTVPAGAVRDKGLPSSPAPPALADPLPVEPNAALTAEESPDGHEAAPGAPKRPRRRTARRRPRQDGDGEKPQAADRGRASWRKVRRGLRVISFSLIGWIAVVALTLLASFLIPVVAGGTSRLGSLGNDLHTVEEAGPACTLVLIGLTTLSSLVNVAQIVGYALCLHVPSRRDAVAWSVVALSLTAVSCGLYLVGLVQPIVAFVAILVGLAGWIAFLFFLRAVGLELDVTWILQEITSLIHFIVVGAGAAGMILVGLFVIADQIADPRRTDEGVPTVLLFGTVTDIILFLALLLVVLFRYLQILRDTSAQIEETAGRVRPVISVGA